MPSKTVYDGFEMLHGGMDAATPPDAVVMANRTAYAVNCSHRGGYPKQRPGLKLHTLDYQSDSSVESNFEGLCFQSAAVYYPDGAPPMIIASIGGHVFTVEPYNNFTVKDVSIPGSYDNSWQLECWWTQVERWMVKQNGIDLPLIYDGIASRRPAADEFKTGTCGAYAWGRYWYALPDGRSYRATDLVYVNGNRDDVLKETENTYLNGGGDFVVPVTAGPIRAMVVPGLADNALGQGPVHIFCENAVFSNQAPVDRDAWQNLTYPIQSMNVVTNGALGDKNTVVINGDIFYRSTDGVRSYILARREFGGWGNTPISREVDLFINNDSKPYLKFGSAVVWKNRMMMTCVPRLQNLYGITHAGIVVMDFDLISTLKGKEPPAWDGMWTGLDFHQLLVINWNGEQRCFAFVREQAAHTLELWEFDDERNYDKESGNRIEWIVVPRQMNFGFPMEMKELQTAELWVDKADGEVNINIQYKPDQHPVPQDWASWTICATTDTCNPTGDCPVVASRHPQYRTAMMTPMPSDTCNEPVGRPMRTAWKFQPILTLTGAARLLQLRMKANIVTDAINIRCGDESCRTLEGCDIDPLTYRADAYII